MKLTITSKNQDTSNSNLVKELEINSDSAKGYDFCQPANGSITLELSLDSLPVEMIVRESGLKVTRAGLSITLERPKDSTQHHFAAKSATIELVRLDNRAPLFSIFCMLDSATATIKIS